ncbi:hypothetical protein [Proteus faecis]|uniref:hypothetical protein n=1 Tax=Proteus faecis TaxID=2050967 RepID=UPI0021BB1ADC|nr:hypothetical protein [Proteus faecis]MCT8248902.1 hypothetical protein [Proteus faecis]
MIIKKNTFEPNILFLNKQHSFPKKECYIFTKNISEIKNTPVAPSFTKRLIHGVISLFHKIEIFFLIKEIKNNKLSGVVDIKKHIKSFDEINVIEDKTINNNLNTVKNIISHANDKFDFYSYCNYLTEVKRAKDFFSSLNNEGDEGGKNKLIVDVLNEIIKNRINALDDKSIKNILKLIFLKFKFENIHLNEKYDFMSNFSTEKERGNFIKSMNFLLISIEEVQLFDKFDNNIKNEVESKLSAIMMIALNKKSDSEYSFDSLMQEWKDKYFNLIKINMTEYTDKPVQKYLSNDMNEGNNLDIEWGDEEKSGRDVLMDMINDFKWRLNLDKLCDEIKDKLIIHDIEECSAKGGVSFDLDKKLTFSRNNYQLYFDKE